VYRYDPVKSTGPIASLPRLYGYCYSEQSLMKQMSALAAAAIGVLSCATLAAVEMWPVGRNVRTADQNGDGRPDIWRHFDTRGQVIEVDVDTNFDGKPDVEEYYERGVLVRRESDRNFNGQADLVEEFDAATHAQTRSVIDIDYDGTADILVLFRDGRPVFSKRTRAKPSDNPLQSAGDQSDTIHLVPLTDPFQSETAIRSTHVAPDDQECVGLSTSGGLPCPRVAALGRLSPSAGVLACGVPTHRSTLRLPRSPRAPPLV
jgi:hypothetical protein